MRSISFRVEASVSQFFSGTTVRGLPYTRFSIDGKSPCGKPVRGTVMCFGETRIAFSNVSENTSKAQMYLTRPQNKRHVLVPVGPFFKNYMMQDDWDQINERLAHAKEKIRIRRNARARARYAAKKAKMIQESFSANPVLQSGENVSH